MFGSVNSDREPQPSNLSTAQISGGFGFGFGFGSERNTSSSVYVQTSSTISKSNVLPDPVAEIQETNIVSPCKDDEANH